ncbi:DUF3802 family protein [Celerinatantimonas yamalensis]|uniref:DUF3802 family protein n=1 Tax=Celerinatantimonas yamalensis TaxID=559956 RepID=A0ABW9G614_9GAMM
MVTNGEGYNQLIQYLTENLSVFEQAGPAHVEISTGEYTTDKVAQSVMAVCQQHPQLSSESRFCIIRESDSVVNDLQEVLSSVWNTHPSLQQCEFLDEFISLIKNLFDSAIYTINAANH